MDLSRFLSLIPISSFFLQNLSESENTLPTTASFMHPIPPPFPGFLQGVPGAALTPFQSVFNREESNSNNTSSDFATTLLQTLWASQLKHKVLTMLWKFCMLIVVPFVLFSLLLSGGVIAVAPASSRAPAPRSSPRALPAALPCQALCLLLLVMLYRSHSSQHSEICPTWKEEGVPPDRGDQRGQESPNKCSPLFHTSGKNLRHILDRLYLFKKKFF